jgi:Asp-tRNA(Asn)/Glu-tRNA(Gln) amidotransferase A subunit family amidase
MPDDDRAISLNPAYDPKAAELLCFGRLMPAFLSGRDSPRHFLERCIETIDAREPSVKAFVTLDLAGARTAADASSRRYKDGQPLSPVDGMPVGIKDIFETIDLPTQRGSEFHKDDYTGRDAAHVYVLRRGGAVIVGKTVTTEFAMARPGPTRNPFDVARTPGGSSSGTSAAIGARMIPVGTGSQARGSIIRPASYCGNYALKPTFGAIHRGGCTDVFKSQDHLGVHAGSLTDMWTVAHYMSEKAGSDPGYPGLFGDAEVPPPRPPRRLGVLRTRGWSLTDERTQDTFNGMLDRLAERGVALLDQETSKAVADYEEALLEASKVWSEISAYEMRWPMQLYRDKDPAKLASWIVGSVARAEAMTLADYRHALRRRDDLRRLHDALAHEVDGYVTLSAPGPAPVGMEVGDAVFNEPASLLGCPALNVPLLAVDGLPVGVQLIGFAHQDRKQCAIASWMATELLGAS